MKSSEFPILKKIRYYFELPFVSFGLIFFGCFSVQKAGDIAAKIAKFIGKKLSVNRLAQRNLMIAMPDFSAQQRREILDGMWDNIGRIIGEFPHICKMRPEETLNFTKFDESSEIWFKRMREKNCGGIIFSGHIGNWEIGSKLLMARGFKVNVVYRPLNNPLVEAKITSLRGAKMIEKNAAGSRKIISALKNKEFVVILADQRAGDGEIIDFFGQKALTTTSIAKLAIRHQVPIIAAYVLRVNREFKFIAHIEEFIGIEQLKNLSSSISDFDQIPEQSVKQKVDEFAVYNRELAIKITNKINQELKSWIKENPSQWFWVHDRWKI